MFYQHGQTKLLMVLKSYDLINTAGRLHAAGNLESKFNFKLPSFQRPTESVDLKILNKKIESDYLQNHLV